MSKKAVHGQPGRIQAPKRGDLVKEAVFALLEEAARGDLRCPTNPVLADLVTANGIPVAGPSIPTSLAALVREGRIIIGYHNQKTRVVTINVGPVRGKSTASPKGYTTFNVVVDAAARAQRDAASLERQSAKREMKAARQGPHRGSAESGGAV